MTRREALDQGNECMAKAQQFQQAADEPRAFTRLDAVNNRWQPALYWQTRALAFYQIAAVLPEV